MNAKPAHPSAAVIIIGAEVLSGKVVDQNGPYFTRALRDRGALLKEIRIVDDTVDAVATAVRTLAADVDFVITTGGLGPTHDDITMHAVATGFDLAVVRHPDLERELRDRFGDRLKAAHLKMAEVPQGAAAHFDAKTWICAVQIKNVIILPGVPSLARLSFERVAEQLRGAPFHSRSLLLRAYESEFAARLERVQQDFPEVSIGSYPRFDSATYCVKVTLDSGDVVQVEQALSALRSSLDDSWIVSENDPEMA